MVVGDTVYTVNAKTNKVDSWIYNGTLRTPDEILVNLVNGKKSCFLPARCVYLSEIQALTVAEISK
jgi:hypothetical protein